MKPGAIVRAKDNESEATSMGAVPPATDEQMEAAWRSLADHFEKSDPNSPMVGLLRDGADRMLRLRSALETLDKWDSLNPPAPMSDFPWCRKVVNDGLGKK